MRPAAWAGIKCEMARRVGRPFVPFVFPKILRRILKSRSQGLGSY